MPDILKDFSHHPFLPSSERGVLDFKTKSFVLLRMLASMGSSPSLIFHIQGAVKDGATQEEIMEGIYLSAYETAKCNIVTIGQGLGEGFRRAEKMKK